MTPRSLMAFCREKGVKAVEIRYVTLSGFSEHVQISVDKLTEDLFETGLPIIAVLDVQHSRECLIIPLANTAYLAPCRPVTTLVLMAEVQDAVTRREDELDARSILQRAEEAWSKVGFGDSLLVAQTCEAYLFCNTEKSRRGWHSHRKLNQSSPTASDELLDSSSDLPSPRQLNNDDRLNGVASVCSEVLQQLSDVGIAVDQVSHSDGVLGRCRFHLAATTPTRAADTHLLTCEIVRMIAANFGLRTSFMPFTSSSHATLGWGLRLAAMKADESLMTGNKQFGLTDKAISATAGILRHLPACSALLAPSENGFRRLNHQSAMFRAVAAGESRIHHAIRVGGTGNMLQDKCIELSVADQTCNPYLALASVIMAAIHGIEENLLLDEHGRCIHPDKSKSQLLKLPRSLDRSLSRLATDHRFLTAHDVFSEQAVHGWIRYIRRHRVDAFSARPSSREWTEKYR